MTLKAIISYDDTPNDQDALMLGRFLAEAGADLTLAYVRHARQEDPGRELDEVQAADALLENGAEWLGDSDVERRVIVNASTAEGLKDLAEEEGADIVVFGSDYRTAAGHVAPQHTAQGLLEGGPAAVAIAPAEYRNDGPSRVARIGVLAAPGDDSAIDTARELADSFDAKVTRDERYVDLLVVGSRTEAPEGRVVITAHAQNEIENATCPVLVVPRGVTLRFPAQLAVS
jgi:nucleotide-binding universal stress UspA family protein